MSKISDLIDSNLITIGTFPTGGYDIIKTTLEALYDGSNEFKKLIDKISLSNPLTINYAANTAVALGNVVTIDHTIRFVYVDKNGVGQQSDIFDVLAHEISHVLNPSDDVTDIIRGGITVNPDYQGVTVRTTNRIMDEYYAHNGLGDFPDRLTYSAMTDVDGLISFATQYTFGEEIDVALLAFDPASNPNSPFAPGRDPNTARNTTNVRDLILGNDELNVIKTGLGRDFIYGGGGDDAISAGSGDDYIDGGSGEDTLYYFSTVMDDASGNSSLGVSARWDSSGLSIRDNYGYIDTVISVEVILSGNYDDDYTLNGDFSDFASPGNAVSITTLFAGEGNETYGDTILMRTTGGVNIDLQGETVTSPNHTGSIAIRFFENAVGSSYNDTIHGSAEGNSLEGTGGNDTIFGGSDSSETSTPADQLFGGGGNDEIHTQNNADGSMLYGGSGDDELHGNGSSTLSGGSGEDTFYIYVDEDGRDTITDLEGHDTLYINDILVEFGSDDIIFGYEIGGPGGGPWYVPASQGGEGFDHGETATAPLAIVIRISSVSDDYTGIRQDIIYDMYIYTDVTIGPINNFGTPGAGQFNLQEADAVIYDLHLGDFGLFLTGGPSPLYGLHNSIFVGPRLAYYEPSITNTNLTVGPIRTLSDRDLILEQMREELDEGFEGGNRISEVQVASAAGTSQGEYLIGNNVGGTFIGAGGDDRIFAGSGHDIISGDEGSDIISGGLGADSINGGIGADVIIGDTSPIDVSIGQYDGGADTIYGGDGNDSLFGDSGDDSLFGDDGNDVIFGGDGNDSIYGGAGNDTLSGDYGTDQIYGGSGDDSITGGEGSVSLHGDDGNDTVTGNYSPDHITGGTGNDLLDGRGSNDTIDGGSGNDTIFGGRGNDTLTGGEGDDSLVGGEGNDRYVYTLGDGHDTIRDDSDSTADVIRLNGVNLSDVTFSRVAFDLILTIAGGGSVTIKYHFSANRVETAAFDDNQAFSLSSINLPAPQYGTDGDDTINGLGTVVNDIIYAGAGNDSVNAGGGADTIYGEDGDDTIHGDDGNDVLYGGAGNDFITDSGGDDSIYGGAGNDRIRSYAGFDLIDGGDGIDEVDFSWVGTGRFDVDLTLGLIPGNTPDTLISIENVTGTQGDNLITGSAVGNLIDGLTGNDTLLGMAGNDTLYGGSGNDSLNGGTGVDSMVGGTGNDTYVIDDIGDIIVEYTSEGIDTVETTINHTLGNYFENLTLLTGDLTGRGNDYANRITGSDGSDTLEGLAGNDSLYGGAGDDRIDGGEGNDLMVGGSGNDTYVVNSTSDTVTEIVGGGDDTIESSVSLTLANEVEHLVLIGDAALNGNGNGLDNRITGNAGANSLSGAAGADTLYGGAGNDTLNGGVGDDLLIGGEGDDTYVVDTAGDAIIEAAGEGNDTVTSSGTWVLGANLENLTFTGSAALDGTGNTNANILTGNTGANALLGLAGDDTLYGGSGNDTLDGG
ncbi:MAG TPA: calcium-binding protein, partial [Trichococcus flocculiformis]|nr:calcium-binding protein [Trichococcus flocculiformis]